MSKIVFQNFTCYYKQKKQFVSALEDVNLTINSGELVVVVGESGSGKTTLLKCCLGLNKYYEGDLFIDDVKVENVSVKSSNVAYVKQELALYPNLTIYENIAFPLRVIHTPHPQVDQKVKDIAKRLGIELLLTRKPRQLSGGQLQRVALARSLVKTPRIVYFDEPFSNLDPVLRVELRQLVKQLHQELRPTIVFVTHDLPEAFALAERIVVLQDGKVEEMGSPQQLRKNPKSELIKSYITQ